MTGRPRLLPPLLLAAVAVALGLALAGASAPRPSRVALHLMAPPMAIWDAQGQVWIVRPPTPAPGAAPPPLPGAERGEELRREIAALAGEMAGELTPAQHEALVQAMDDQSARHGEVSTWRALEARLSGAPGAASPTGGAPAE